MLSEGQQFGYALKRLNGFTVIYIKSSVMQSHYLFNNEAIDTALSFEHL